MDEENKNKIIKKQPKISRKRKVVVIESVQFTGDTG